MQPIRNCARKPAPPPRSTRRRRLSRPSRNSSGFTTQRCPAAKLPPQRPEAMTDFLARMGGFVEKLRSSPMPLPTVSEIAHDRCLPSGVAGREIVKDNGYFTVWLNELFLAEGRNWWATYDPVAIVITEFGYGTGRVSVPIVVGPNLISAKNPGVPHGIVLRDTCVAGPYPFRGGNVAITVILYKVKHQDYARGLLRFVESLSSAIGTPADIGML